MANDMHKVGDYDIDKSETLGRGAFGSVYKGTHYNTKQSVVAKVIYIGGFIREYALAEVAILKLGKRHDNIVQILYDEEQGSELWIVMEHCNRGNLANYAKITPLDLFNKMDIVHQCTNALVYLLNLKPKRVIHRDIKPGNVLMKDAGDGVVAMISDFGVSKAMDETSATRLGSTAGTPHFMAPEQFEDAAEYNRAVDVYALGVLVHYLLRVIVGDDMEDLTFLGRSIGQKMFVYGEDGIEWSPVEIKVGDTEEVKLVKQLLQKMIVLNPDDRISMEQVQAEVERIKEELRAKVTKKVKLTHGKVEPQGMACPAAAPAPAAEPSSPYTSQPAAPASTQAAAAQSYPAGAAAAAQLVIAKSAPQIKRVQTERLTMMGQDYTGYGEKMLIVEEDHCLVKYSVEDGEMREMWTKPTPPGLNQNGGIVCITESFLVFNGDYDDVSHTFSHELENHQTYEEGYGFMLIALPHDRILCARMPDISGNKKELDVYQLPGHTRVTTLSRPQKLFSTSHSISACYDARTHMLAVLQTSWQNDPSSLDMYNNSFQHINQVELQYDPRSVASLASVKNWLLVVDSDQETVHVHNWFGEELGIFTCQELDLGNDYCRKIIGVGRVAGEKLIMARGPDGSTLTTLHLFNLM